MEIKYLDKAGLTTLWNKVKSKVQPISDGIGALEDTVSENKRTIQSQIDDLKRRVLVLEGGSVDIPEGDFGIVYGNNVIEVSDSISGNYTLVYLDANGHELANYDEITIQHG